VVVHHVAETRGHQWPLVVRSVAAGGRWWLDRWPLVT